MRVAIVVILGAIMSVLDTTIVNVALHDLSGDLHASLGSIQWVITGYLLSLAAVIPVTGWAVRRFSARRLYLIALVVFTAGSALCALAATSGELIAFRVLQGIGGGMITPIGQMILVKAAGPRNLPEGDELHRRSDRARAGLRPDARRPAAADGRVAVDLPDQRARRRAGLRAGVAAAAARRSRLHPGGTPRRARPGAGRGRRGRHHLRPVRERDRGKPYRVLGARAGARRPRPPGAVRPALAADQAPAARSQPVRQPGLPGRLDRHLLPRRRAVRRDDPDAPVLPDRPRPGRDRHRSAADPPRGSAAAWACSSPDGSRNASAPGARH